MTNKGLSLAKEIEEFLKENHKTILEELIIKITTNVDN